MVDFDYVIVGAEPPALCWLTGFLRTRDNQVLLLEYGADTNPMLQGNLSGPR